MVPIFQKISVFLLLVISTLLKWISGPNFPNNISFSVISDFVYEIFLLIITDFRKKKSKIEKKNLGVWFFVFSRFSKKIQISKKKIWGLKWNPCKFEEFPVNLTGDSLYIFLFFKSSEYRSYWSFSPQWSQFFKSYQLYILGLWYKKGPLIWKKKDLWVRVRG